MVKQNYGKYIIPTMLDQVITFQRQLNEKKWLPFGDLLSYYFGYESVKSRYLNTPLDAISFAHPGMDGIHFCFLTDFGQIEHLDTAYIVRVSPMDFGDPVKIVAKNFVDFLRISCYYPFSLINLHINSSETEINNHLDELPMITTNDLQYNEQFKVNRLFTEKFQLKPIDCLYTYFQHVNQERRSETVKLTIDRIGITQQHLTEHHGSKLNHPTFPLHEQQQLNLNDILTFFNAATRIEKLCFIRDAQSLGLLFDNYEVKQYIKNQLISLGLYDEAVRLEYPKHEIQEHAILSNQAHIVFFDSNKKE